MEGGVTDPILKKAMDKRDEALREVERWEEWIKAYGELSHQPLESLDIPMANRTLPRAVGISPAALANSSSSETATWLAAQSPVAARQ